MNELLKALYDHFYEPLPETELNMYEKTRPMLTPREMVADMDAFIHDEN